MEHDDGRHGDIADKAEAWVVKLSKFVINNTTEFMTDRYASHVIRTLLELLGGKNVQKDLPKRKSANKFPSAQSKLVPSLEMFISAASCCTFSKFPVILFPKSISRIPKHCL